MPEVVMAKLKSPVPPRKLVWRISDTAPAGEWVDPVAAGTVPPPGDVPEVSSGGWVMSSFDLLHGSDISDADDTVPGELLDELFPPPTPAPADPAKK
jgi:hypothetical protein